MEVKVISMSNVNKVADWPDGTVRIEVTFRMSDGSTKVEPVDFDPLGGAVTPAPASPFGRLQASDKATFDGICWQIKDKYKSKYQHG